MIDRTVRAAFLALGAVPVTMLTIVFVYLGWEAWPLLADLSPGSLVAELLSTRWAPSRDAFGIAYPLIGTLVTAVIALPLALGMALACAVVVHYFLPPAASGVARQGLTILAAVPSVLYGLWGLTLVAPMLAVAQPPGLGLATVGIALAIMITPMTAMSIESGFFAADERLEPAARAMGLSRATTVFAIMLPACKGSIAGGMMLGLARAIGETMVVLMLAGNTVDLPLGPLESYRTLSSHIALEVPFAMGDHRAALYAAALVLALTVILLVRLLTSRVFKGAP